MDNINPFTKGETKSTVAVTSTVPSTAVGYGEGFSSVSFTPINEYVGAALQELYGWVNNSIFYSISDYAMRPFYRLVQSWEYWVNGFVPLFHNVSNGCVPTRFAKSICDKVSSLVYGGGVMFSLLGGEADKEGENSTLSKISEWSQKCKFKEALKSGIDYAVTLGTSALKINVSEGRPWVDAVPFSRFFANLNARGDVERIAFYLRPLTKTQAGEGNTFHLFEERYWERNEKGERTPYVKYSVYMTNSLVNQFVPFSNSYGWMQLPRSVRDTLRTEFSAYKVEEPQRLPFTTLGVQLLKYTPSSSRMPWLKFGDSVLDGIVDSLCDYDLLNAAKRTEIYTARPRIIAKKGMTNPSAISVNANSGIDSFLYTEYESTDMADKGIHVMQPEMRSESFRAMRNSILEDIATAIGISPSSFAPYLQDNSNRTAREVSAEESATALFVETKREIMTDPINALLADVCGYLGLIDRVGVRWSLAGQSNYTLLTENIAKLRQAGLMSLETAVASVHPDWDEGQIQTEIERIKTEQEQAAAQGGSMFDNALNDLLNDEGGGAAGDSAVEENAAPSVEYNAEGDAT